MANNKIETSISVGTGTGAIVDTTALQIELEALSENDCTLQRMEAYCTGGVAENYAIVYSWLIADTNLAAAESAIHTFITAGTFAFAPTVVVFTSIE